MEVVGPLCCVVSILGDRLVCGVALVGMRIRWNLGEGRELDSLSWVVVVVENLRLTLLLDLEGGVELGRCGGIRQSKAWMKAGHGSAVREGENAESS